MASPGPDLRPFVDGIENMTVSPDVARQRHFKEQALRV
jgi:hypothetical protein